MVEVTSADFNGLVHGFDTDKIAIPDFGTGAMENWGLITYRETNLLYDENQSSSYNKQRVASVIAHELVHQVTLYACYLPKCRIFVHFAMLHIHQSAKILKPLNKCTPSRLCTS